MIYNIITFYKNWNINICVALAVKFSEGYIAIQTGRSVNLSELEFINIVGHKHVTSVKLHRFNAVDLLIQES